jgi:hypothetical protein
MWIYHAKNLNPGINNEAMMYPFITLKDDTEITHSERKPDGSVKVYIETPDDDGGFHSATCWLPEFRWEADKGYSVEEMRFFKGLVLKNAYQILQRSVTLPK